MTTDTKELIAAIEAGKSSDIQDTFDKIMIEKTSNAVHNFRDQIVSKMFAPVEEAPKE